jgi:ferredoxin/flavodoxin---NADP+ reductase
VNCLLAKRDLAPGIVLLEIEAPRIAAHSRAGQFVVLRPAAHSERIPLTVVHADPSRGVITLVVQVAGKTTQTIANLAEGDPISDVLGPLGQPARIEKVGHVLCAGGGIGVAALLPVIRAARAAGNKVTALCGARSKPYMILSGEVASSASEVVWATEDGSAGLHGNVVELMQTWIRSQDLPPALAYLVGPVAMMRAAAEVTRGWRVPTTASLNPIMIDGIGMCGGCRVIAGGATRFACVDGPEFDAHQVDFEDLARRNRAYTQQERQAILSQECKIGNPILATAPPTPEHLG